MTRRRLPFALVLLVGAGCAMRGASPEPEPSGGATGQAASVSTGADSPRADREVDDAPATESTYGGAAPPRAPTTSPGTSPVPESRDVPQSTTVETVVVGRATSDSVRTVGGNATAGSAWARLVDTEDALHDALGLASVDCDAARDLRDRICGLGDRICSIANDHPDDHVTEDRCEDGRDRCERARRRVDDRCD